MSPAAVSLQNVDRERARLEADFLELKARHPERLADRLTLSWSNWGFGIEELDVSCARLASAGLTHVELHGNHYGPDLGYQVEPTLDTLRRHGPAGSGV